MDADLNHFTPPADMVDDELFIETAQAEPSREGAAAWNPCRVPPARGWAHRLKRRRGVNRPHIRSHSAES